MRARERRATNVGSPRPQLQGDLQTPATAQRTACAFAPLKAQVTEAVVTTSQYTMDSTTTTDQRGATALERRATNVGSPRPQLQGDLQTPATAQRTACAFAPLKAQVTEAVVTTSQYTMDSTTTTDRPTPRTPSNSDKPRPWIPHHEPPATATNHGHGFRHTLKRKSKTSPSATTYSLPSLRITPASRAAVSEPRRS